MPGLGAGLTVLLLVIDGRVVVDRRMQSIGVEAVDPAVGLGFELVVYQTRYGTGYRYDGG